MCPTEYLPFKRFLERREARLYSFAAGLSMLQIALCLTIAMLGTAMEVDILGGSPYQAPQPSLLAQAWMTLQGCGISPGLLGVLAFLLLARRLWTQTDDSGTVNLAPLSLLGAFTIGSSVLMVWAFAPFRVFFSMSLR